jgi:ABC-type dipeptide/oligopeptide/nickel transport system permease component
VEEKRTMSKPLIDRIPFTRIVTVLAIVFGVSLGLCGLTLVVSNGADGAGFLMGLGMLELIAMALSALGLLLTLVAWVTLAVIGSFQAKVSQPQKLFDKEDDTNLDDRENPD